MLIILSQEGNGELIYYERPDFDGPKISNYSKTMIADPTSLKQVLAMALGVKGYVKVIIIYTDYLSSNSLQPKCY